MSCSEQSRRSQILREDRRGNCSTASTCHKDRNKSSDQPSWRARSHPLQQQRTKYRRKRETGCFQAVKYNFTQTRSPTRRHSNNRQILVDSELVATDSPSNHVTSRGPLQNLLSTPCRNANKSVLCHPERWAFADESSVFVTRS